MTDYSMEPNIVFEAKIAIGVRGIALLLLFEQGVNGRETTIVQYDIDRDGLQSWFCYLRLQTWAPGIYHLRGKATHHFEDELPEYSNLKIVQVK